MTESRRFINRKNSIMSKLYKRADSPYLWYSASVHGRRVRISTGTHRRRTAERIQDAWDFKLSQGDTSFFEPEETIDVLEYIDQHRDFLEDRKSEQTVLIAKGVLAKFGKYLTGIGIQSIPEIQVQHIDGYMDSMKQKSKTKKNHLGIISRMLKQCVREGLIERNPCDLATPPRVVHELKHRPLNAIDLKAIFKNAGEWKLYYSFLLYTGLRAGDVALLKFEHIDIKRHRITQLIRKSRRVHELPLAAILVREIGDIKGLSGPVFPDLYSESERKLNDNLAHPRLFLQDLLSVAELPKATLHSFRVTYNNLLRDGGLTIQDRQVLMAHTSSETTKIYTHPNPELAEKHLNDLPDYLIHSKG
mgnify:FL=1